MVGAVILLVVLAGLAVLFVATWSIRRHGEADHVEPGWRPTEERFVDPGTGRRMRVYLDGEGGRHYIHDR
jgi:hypothetical protein